MQISGNIVGPDRAGFGTLCWENGRIESVNFLSEVRNEENWLVPGFVESHLHGMGKGNAEHGYDGVKLMAEAAPRSGVTTMVPALASDTPQKMLDFVDTVRQMTEADRLDNCCCIAGSHLEGPFLAPEYAGGMNPAVLRMPDRSEVDRWLAVAKGTLKIVTLAPELPGAQEVIKLLRAHNTAVSCGHSALKADALSAMSACGVSRMCHLFDAYPPREVVSGVSIPTLSDAAITDDSLMLEIILDTFHVPPPLVMLALRGAGVSRIIGITDALQGTGLPDAEYEDCGRAYRLTNGGVCRLVDEPDIIVGSCLTMNRAFYNLVKIFHCTPVEAAAITAYNPARSINLDGVCGALIPGLRADIAVLGPDMLTVQKTFCAGQEVFSC